MTVFAVNRKTPTISTTLERPDEAIGTAIAFFPDRRVVSSAEQTGDGLYMVVSLKPAPNWLDECINHVRQLRQLAENWDSYGGRSVDVRSVNAAVRLLEWVASHSRIDRPRIAASPAGNVALTWEWADYSRELDIEVLPDRLRYSFVDETDGRRDAEGETIDPGTVVALRMQ